MSRAKEDYHKLFGTPLLAAQRREREVENRRFDAFAETYERAREAPECIPDMEAALAAARRAEAREQTARRAACPFCCPCNVCACAEQARGKAR
jgi:hypothetical protein